LSIKSFSLQGGRLDVVHGRTITALVYGHRMHLVSAFIWPTREKDAALRSGSQHGYEWIAWRKGGMTFCDVSDAAPPNPKQLERMLVQ
jgi:anti-sigma factor RsiW